MRSIQIAKSLFLLLLAMSFALPAFAQSDVSAARGARKLRFASQRPVEHLRLQVHDAAGALIHVGTFKIDHPLDPENKYLYHSFVESPDMMNIYNGIVTLGKDGSAEVTLPDWFEALNREFRYQLTCIGGFAPVYVAKKVNGNRFKIAGGKPGMEVSWQLTGVRKDAYAETHRIQVEEMKPIAERGSYLHPEAFGKSAERRTPGGTQDFADSRQSILTTRRPENRVEL